MLARPRTPVSQPGCSAAASVLAYALGTPDELLGRLSAALTTFGVTALLAAEARDRGRRLQDQLWMSRGGPPTTTMLLSTSRDPSPSLVAHRRHVRRLLPDAEPLSDERYRSDPDESRLTIERYVTHLRERTRDRDRLPIVFDANASYGFRRNTLGLRPVGIVIAGVTTVVSTAALFLVGTDRLDQPAPAVALALVVGLVALVVWIRATPAWVRVQANRYAEALLSAAEALEAPTAV